MALCKYAFLTGALTIAILQGCGSDDSAPAATGGAAGTGGTGGSAGTGGAGTGGVATGGAAGTGGSAGTGGAGTGGTVVVDSGPVVCSTAPYNNVFRFLGPTSDAWSINSLSMPPDRLAPGTNSETGAPTGTLLEIDPNDGSPAPGSVKLSIPFAAPADQLIFQQLYGNGAPGVNLTGTTVSALVRLDSLANGAVSSVVQGAIALKSTGGYVYAQSASVNLQTGAWVTVSMSADSAPIMNSSFDNCDVREIDVLIITGASGTYGPAVVHVDTIAITSGDAGVPPEPDGGAPVNPDATVEAAADARDAGVDRAAESAAPETGGAPDASE